MAGGDNNIRRKPVNDGRDNRSQPGETSQIREERKRDFAQPVQSGSRSTPDTPGHRQQRDTYGGGVTDAATEMLRRLSIGRENVGNPHISDQIEEPTPANLDDYYPANFDDFGYFGPSTDAKKRDHGEPASAETTGQTPERPNLGEFNTPHNYSDNLGLSTTYDTSDHYQPTPDTTTLPPGQDIPSSSSAEYGTRPELPGPSQDAGFPHRQETLYTEYREPAMTSSDVTWPPPTEGMYIIPPHTEVNPPINPQQAMYGDIQSPQFHYSPLDEATQRFGGPAQTARFGEQAPQTDEIAAYGSASFSQPEMREPLSQTESGQATHQGYDRPYRRTDSDPARITTDSPSKLSRSSIRRDLTTTESRTELCKDIVIREADLKRFKESAPSIELPNAHPQDLRTLLMRQRSVIDAHLDIIQGYEDLEKKRSGMRSRAWDTSHKNLVDATIAAKGNAVQELQAETGQFIESVSTLATNIDERLQRNEKPPRPLIDDYLLLEESINSLKNPTFDRLSANDSTHKGLLRDAEATYSKMRTTIFAKVAEIGQEIARNYRDRTASLWQDVDSIERQFYSELVKHRDDRNANILSTCMDKMNTHIDSHNPMKKEMQWLQKHFTVIFANNQDLQAIMKTEEALQARRADMRNFLSRKAPELAGEWDQGKLTRTSTRTSDLNPGNQSSRQADIPEETLPGYKDATGQKKKGKKTLQHPPQDTSTRFTFDLAVGRAENIRVREANLERGNLSNHEKLKELKAIVAEYEVLQNQRPGTIKRWAHRSDQRRANYELIDRTLKNMPERIQELEKEVQHLATYLVNLAKRLEGWEKDTPTGGSPIQQLRRQKVIIDNYRDLHMGLAEIDETVLNRFPREDQSNRALYESLDRARQKDIDTLSMILDLNNKARTRKAEIAMAYKQALRDDPYGTANRRKNRFDRKLLEFDQALQKSDILSINLSQLSGIEASHRTIAPCIASEDETKWLLANFREDQVLDSDATSGNTANYSGVIVENISVNDYLRLAQDTNAHLERQRSKMHNALSQRIPGLAAAFGSYSRELLTDMGGILDQIKSMRETFRADENSVPAPPANRLRSTYKISHEYQNSIKSNISFIKSSDWNKEGWTENDFETVADLDSVYQDMETRLDSSVNAAGSGSRELLTKLQHLYRRDNPYIGPKLASLKEAFEQTKKPSLRELNKFHQENEGYSESIKPFHETWQWLQGQSTFKDEVSTIGTDATDISTIRERISSSIPDQIGALQPVITAKEGELGQRKPEEKVTAHHLGERKSIIDDYDLIYGICDDYPKAAARISPDYFAYIASQRLKNVKDFDNEARAALQQSTQHFEARVGLANEAEQLLSQFEADTPTKIHARESYSRLRNALYTIESRAKHTKEQEEATKILSIIPEEYPTQSIQESRSELVESMASAVSAEEKAKTSLSTIYNRWAK